MCEEHGYQRSGKKCREKFENLYKYYKKTKEGKAGRQDGKHYRFFRQLEALYGEANSSASMSEAHASYKAGFVARGHDPRVSDTSLSLSNCSDEADTSSSEEDGESGGMMKMKKRGGNWKAKIREFIDGQMKKLMEKQEAWMEKMMSVIEDKERERAMREEEWRRQDAARIEREHKFWASERAWIEARDAALMEALHKFTSSKEESMGGDSGGGGGGGGEIWPESEINRLIQLTTAMEGKFEQRGAAEEMVWEEIASKMGCYGHERSGAMCREKWESINNYVLKCSKKRKDNTKNCTNYGGGGGMYCDNSSEQGNNNGDHHHHNHHQNLSLSGHDHGGSSPNPNAISNAAINESCFRYFMGDGYGRIID